MDVKEAVAIAKQYISDLFSGEQVRNVGLEEMDSMTRRTLGMSPSAFRDPGIANEP
jgi:hypothetical protein